VKRTAIFSGSNPSLGIGTRGFREDVMRRAGLAILGFAVGGLCLWLSSRTVDWQEAARIFRGARASDLAIGIALFGANMILRALRWQTILAFRARVGLGMSLQALLAGYAANTILPARLGEFYRTHYLAWRTGLSGSAVFASIVIERLLDLAAVICALAIGMALVGGSGGTSRHVLIGGPWSPLLP
jgi:glycosyltransferase 2 family protein